MPTKSGYAKVSVQKSKGKTDRRAAKRAGAKKSARKKRKGRK